MHHVQIFFLLKTVGSIGMKQVMGYTVTGISVEGDLTRVKKPFRTVGTK